MNRTCLTSGFAALVCSLSLIAGGCMSGPEHRAAVQDNAGRGLSVGTVQKDVRIGMSGGEVIALLGAPNIVTTDDERREVWVYDKIASEVVRSSSALSLIPLLGLSGSSIVGGASGGLAQSAGAESRTQRTLTVIIKFDPQNRVRDFAYHATHF
jgi:hypothetical protein